MIDKYGWLGEDVVGHHGNKTIFAVIQHADLQVQLKYLPLMRQAVKDGKAHGSDLAYLEDRVAIGLGKNQYYGTQIRYDPDTRKNQVSPIEDECQVDARRASLGMEPLEIYAKSFHILYLPCKQ